MKKVIIAAMFMIPMFTNAASFDCNNVFTSVEMTICEDSKLSGLDEEMSRVYKLARIEDPSLVESQREWVKVRNNATSIDQLDDLHNSRIAVLKSYIEPEIKPMTRENVSQVKPMERTTESKPVKDIVFYVDEINRTGGMTDSDYGFIYSDKITPGYPVWLENCGIILSDEGFGIFSQEAKKLGQFGLFQQNEMKFRHLAINLSILSLLKEVGGNMQAAKLACMYGV